MLFRIIGIIGLVLIILGLAAKADKQRYAYFSLGGIGLLLYSLSINELVFVALYLIFTWISFGKYRQRNTHSIKRPH